jgi:uncharacterized protein YxjI
MQPDNPTPQPPQSPQNPSSAPSGAAMATTPSPADSDPASLPAGTYRIHEDLSLFKEGFHLYNQAGQVVYVVQSKALDIRDSMTIFADEAKTQVAFNIRQQNLLGLSTTWQVLDPKGGWICSFRLNRLKSAFNEQWDIIDSIGRVVGSISQSAGKAMLGRLIKSKSMSQQFSATVGGKPAATYATTLDTIGFNMDIQVLVGDSIMAPRILLAAAVLLASRHGITS